uniref:Erythroid cell-specific and testis-specific protein 2 (ERT-2) n=1 Tax=Mus musculus TaxID=10090 RepID=Q9Z0Q0_MOUSE|nr:erythroid cell-specific and testis-specific protein 2 (ERT-2) [Mus musculus]
MPSRRGTSNSNSSRSSRSRNRNSSSSCNSSSRNSSNSKKNKASNLQPRGPSRVWCEHSAALCSQGLHQGLHIYL